MFAFVCSSEPGSIFALDTRCRLLNLAKDEEVETGEPFFNPWPMLLLLNWLVSPAGDQANRRFISALLSIRPRLADIDGLGGQRNLREQLFSFCDESQGRRSAFFAGGVPS